MMKPRTLLLALVSTSAIHATSLHVCAQGATVPSPDTIRRVVAVPDTEPPIVAVDLGRAELTVQSGRSGEVEVVLSTLPGRGGPLPPPDELVSVTSSGGAVRITATGDGRGDRGLAVTVVLPEGSILEVRMERGDITVADAVAALDLATSRGDVRIRNVTGSALVNVENGSITASFRGVDPARPNAFATLNGSVDLTVPREAPFDLDVRCRGCGLEDVALDGPLRQTRILDAGDGDPILGLRGAVHGGGSRIRIFTWNGEVRIRAN